MNVWVEVSESALRHNFRQVRAAVPESVRLAAVVKANGYGHGPLAARVFAEEGADLLCVTRLEEAAALRIELPDIPILVLAPILPDEVGEAARLRVECAFDSAALGRALEAAGVPAHLKIDSGMGRLGVLPSCLSEVAAIPRVGVFTHFARAMEADLGPTRRQWEAFSASLDSLGETGRVHAANSAAVLRLPETHANMVRVGTLLYGQYPSASVPKTLDLKPTWALKARIVSLRELPAGSPIGYGADFVTRRTTRIAVLPLGFSDGLTLTPEGPIYRQPAWKLLGRRARYGPSVEILGRPAPILGRVSMQLAVADVTDIAGVTVGTEAKVPALRLATPMHIPRVRVD